MSYTPINWQTGDTITAEKLNKMDNGWSVSTTPLFSETVTTSGEYPEGTLTYSNKINADTLLVTFNGTDYLCEFRDVDGDHCYGDVDGSYSVYPFSIVSIDGGENIIYTENVGTYTVVAKECDISTSAYFESAVVETIPNNDFEIVPRHYNICRSKCGFYRQKECVLVSL